MKNPFGSLQTNPQADAGWVALIFLLEKVFFWNTLVVIAGDNFEKEEDLQDPDLWKSAGSEDEEK